MTVAYAHFLMFQVVFTETYVQPDLLLNVWIAVALFGVQCGQGGALIAIGKRPPSAEWRLLAVGAALVALLLSPVGLGLGLVTCGGGTILHGVACLALFGTLFFLLRQRVARGMRAHDE